MNSFVLAVGAVGAMATIFVLHFTICIIRKWLQGHKLRHHGAETSARIVQAQVINETGRYLPYVRLKLEVTNAEKNFIAEADSFFSVPELSELMVGNSIRVRYHPENLAQVQIVKEMASFKTTPQHSWQPFADTGRLALAR